MSTHAEPEIRHEQVVARSSAGRFVRGAPSPNPGGRSRAEGDVRALARQHTEEALQGILAIARSQKAPAQARLNAWTAILDRGYGRPGQTLALTDDRTVQERNVMARLAEEFTRVAAETALEVADSRRQVQASIIAVSEVD